MGATFSGWIIATASAARSGPIVKWSPMQASIRVIFIDFISCMSVNSSVSPVWYTVGPFRTAITKPTGLPAAYETSPPFSFAVSVEP